MEDYKRIEREEIFSKRLKAGKRTYFFDVNATRNKDYYLTITESKKKFTDQGGYTYEKHKLFLYKEDFNKFVKALDETVDHIKKELLPDYDFSQFDRDEASTDDAAQKNKNDITTDN